jgi:hypothetical protein
MLDLGANTDCDANNLVQFAVMGAAYARTAMGLERPRVALLNIGTEELKGTDEIRDAAAILRDATGLPMEFARQCRCRRPRWFFGQYRAQDDRGDRAVRDRSAAARLHLVGAVEDRFSDLAAGDRIAAPPSRPQ